MLLCWVQAGKLKSPPPHTHTTPGAQVQNHNLLTPDPNPALPAQADQQPSMQAPSFVVNEIPVHCPTLASTHPHTLTTYLVRKLPIATAAPALTPAAPASADPPRPSRCTWPSLLGLLLDLKRVDSKDPTSTPDEAGGRQAGNATTGSQQHQHEVGLTGTVLKE